MKLAIMKYNAGNTASVVNCVRRFGVEPDVTDDPEILSSADKVIFPGVGEASSAMMYLEEKGLDLVIRSLTNPVLGICLGMQVMCATSEENSTSCLNVIGAQVKRFPRSALKVPHIGWNSVQIGNSALFNGVRSGEYFYFVHGYYVEKGGYTTATCNYGREFSAAFERENFFGVQFHPERSGKAGEIIMENFLNL
ncbi:MAG TPA: imidazole glycerol phosphate synthase subunit HisH [Pyrinomonadaceae bacterium]|nr:imidazole glycerol phosphate synthase subunit HisH [Pyrinomonadaceae bacterium]